MHPEHPAKLTQVRTLFDNEFAKSEHGSKLLENCSIVIGMHPGE